MNEQLQQVECPNCGYELSVDIVTSFSIEDRALEDLFNSSLNVVVCDQCKVSFLNDISLIFRDNKQNYFIYYIPKGENQSEQKLLAQMQELVSYLDLREEDYPELRLTLSRQNFIEKIALHIEELDDKVVEYLKFQIFFSENNLDRKQHHLFYNFSVSNKKTYVLRFLIIKKKKLLMKLTYLVKFITVF